MTTFNFTTVQYCTSEPGWSEKYCNGMEVKVRKLSELLEKDKFKIA